MSERQGNEAAPLSPQESNQDQSFRERPPSRWLLTFVVMGVTACVCVSTIILSGLGGYQDAFNDVRTESAATSVAEVEKQYQLAQEDLEAGLFYDAYIRLEFVVTEQPNYLDASDQYNSIAVQLSATPTPFPTVEPTVAPSETPTVAITLTPTIDPTESSVAEITPTQASAFDVELAFNQAKAVYEAGLWEEAIERLDIVVAIDPAYQRNEVDQMLFDALKQQALLYFRARNQGTGDTGLAGDQLARGVQFAYRAAAILERNPNAGTLALQPVGSLTGERIFVENFLTARDYVNSGQYADAIPILEDLCNNSNCGWAYGGVTVRSLLDRAIAGN